MAGCFLAAVPGGRPAGDRSQFVEDGFLLSLSAVSYRALREALKRGSALVLPASPDSFRLEWAPGLTVERVVRIPAREPESEPIPLESMTRKRSSGRGAAALE